MAGAMTFQFDQADVDRLNNRMLAVQGLANRSPRAVIWVTAKKLSWNLYRNTALAQKTAPKVEAGNGKVMAWIVPKNGAFPKFLPVSVETARKYGLKKPRNGATDWKRQRYTADGTPKVMGRGYARAAWLAIIARMGWGRGSKQSSAARKYSDDKVTQSENGAVAAIELANQIPYIVAMDHGQNGNPPGNILSKAINATIGELERDMVNLARKLERTLA